MEASSRTVIDACVQAVLPILRTARISIQGPGKTYISTETRISVSTENVDEVYDKSLRMKRLRATSGRLDYLLSWYGGWDIVFGDQKDDLQGECHRLGASLHCLRKRY